MSLVLTVSGWAAVFTGAVLAVYCLRVRRVVSGWWTILCVAVGAFSLFLGELLDEGARMDQLMEESRRRSSIEETPAADPAVSALDRACGALTESTEGTIVADWDAARHAAHVALRSQEWMRDRFTWLQVHPIEGVLAVCGIPESDTPRSLRMLASATRAGNATSPLVIEERYALCAYGEQLAEAQTSSPWDSDARIAWQGACVRALSSGRPEPDAPDLPVEPKEEEPGVEGARASADGAAPATPEPAHRPTCAGLEELHALRGLMEAMQLRDEDWLAYGVKLAVCDPAAEAWVQLELPGGRMQFRDEYYLTFLNGDVIQGDPFRSRHANAHAAIRVHAGVRDE